MVSRIFAGLTRFSRPGSRRGWHRLRPSARLAVEPPHDDERQDDLPILGLLEVAPENFGNRPDEGGSGESLGFRAVHQSPNVRFLF
jgi:hypothetical protein